LNVIVRYGVPVAEHAKALKLSAHDADEALRERAAGATEIRGRQLALLRAELTIDLQLDRQAVAVVAGMYGASKPAIVFDLTTRSFRILLRAVPMWILPFAYGGPSCNTNFGAPRRASRICV
jgi:hypothetical protein